MLQDLNLDPPDQKCDNLQKAMEPTYAFSIPSIQDDTPLDCRIYHPKNLHFLLGDKQRPIKGSIVAHPYPPLGGCYDDPVVLSVAETLVEQGYIVGTFNFRGAGGSESKTSWSGKAEQDDYSSVAGFVAYYLHSLKPAEDLNRLETIPSAGNNLEQREASNSRPSQGHIELLLAGYSYGSLVLARLQPMTSIIQRIESAEMGTAGAEIILRAHTLAKQTRHSLEEMYSPSSPRGRQLKPEDAATSPTKRIGASPITMGGEETDPSDRRRSRDSRRSIDLVRKSVEMPNRIKARIKRNSTPGASSSRDKSSETPITPISAALESTPAVDTRYLIISPVLLPFTQVLCPPGPPGLPGLRRSATADSNVGTFFLQNPTLAIFGSADGFTSGRRLKAWAQKMSKDTSSSFGWYQIDGAGHFWREAGVMQALQQKIAAWVKSR